MKEDFKLNNFKWLINIGTISYILKIFYRRFLEVEYEVRLLDVFESIIFIFLVVSTVLFFLFFIRITKNIFEQILLKIEFILFLSLIESFMYIYIQNKFIDWKMFLCIQMINIGAIVSYDSLIIANLETKGLKNQIKEYFKNLLMAINLKNLKIKKIFKLKNIGLILNCVSSIFYIIIVTFVIYEYLFHVSTTYQIISRNNKITMILEEKEEYYKVLEVFIEEKKGELEKEKLLIQKGIYQIVPKDDSVVVFTKKFENSEIEKLDCREFQSKTKKF